ncbi:carbohydrate-binding module family 1 protein, partial [Oidiodendron maius Zn]
WGQCGGIGLIGPTVCVSPYTCRYSNPYYSRCLSQARLCSYLRVLPHIILQVTCI